MRCIWTGGNASEITVQLNYFDSFGGGDFEVTGMVARDVGGTAVGLEGDLGTLHLLAGDGGRLDGWWEGDLRGADAAGQEVQLSAIVFRGAPVEMVAGR